MASENDWKVDRIDVSGASGDAKLSVIIDGPNGAYISVKPDLHKDWKSLTIRQIEELAIAEAKRVSPK